jgi:hypothetical protein
MNDTHTHFLDLAKGVQPPDKDILSRTLFNDDRLKVVAFGFAQGEAKLTLGDDRTRQRRAPGSTCLPACATASRPRHPWSCCCCC